MKNLRKILGLMVMTGFAFGAAGTVSAASYSGSNATDLTSCLSSNDMTSTCTVTGNVTVNALTVNKAVKLNINSGKTITVNGPITVVNGANLTINGGTIKATSTTNANAIVVNSGATLKTDNVKLMATAATPVHDTQSVIAVIGGAASTTDKTTVTIGSKTEVSGYAGLIVYPDSARNSVGSADNVSVSLNGTWNTTSYTVQTQGLIKNGNGPELTIAGGSYTSKDNVALYSAGKGSWDITSGKFSGTEAMTIKAGKVEISGGSFTATSNVCSYTNGTHTGSPASHAQATGAALNIVTDSNYAKNIDLDITGGTFKSEKCAAIFTYDNDSTNSLDISGGTFTSPEDVEVLMRTGSGRPTGFISGGQFSGKIAALTSNAGGALSNNLASSTVNGVTYIGEGYEATVEADDEFGTVDSLIGDKISLVAGVTYKISDFIEVTPDAGYHVVYNVVDNDDKVVTVTNGEFKMPEADVTIKVSFAAGEEQDPNAGDDNKPNTGDNEPSENPKTFDAIGSLVTLAVSSLGVAGTATKKVLK